MKGGSPTFALRHTSAPDCSPEGDKTGKFEPCIVNLMLSALSVIPFLVAQNPRLRFLRGGGN